MQQSSPGLQGTHAVSLRGQMVTIGSILRRLDPRSLNPEVKVRTVSLDGESLRVINTATGRLSTLNVTRLRNTYGQANGFSVVSL
jgi:hypothetical protein